MWKVSRNPKTFRSVPSIVLDDPRHARLRMIVHRVQHGIVVPLRCVLAMKIRSSRTDVRALLDRREVPRGDT